MTTQGKRLGFFTRLLDRGSAAERYRLATEQIVEAERCGFDSAWIAQHHFHEDEGGLPSPFVFLAHVAAKTSRIRLGTGVVTLPMENAVRVAEDAVVLDLLSSGRLEFGVGSGGTPSSFLAFGETNALRGPAMARNLAILRDAWAGRPLRSPDNVLYPPAGNLDDRIWQATFSVEGGGRAGEAGDGLMLSRTQPRPSGSQRATLAEIQNPIIDAYLAALPPGRAARILGSRTLFVAESRSAALRVAEEGLRHSVGHFAANGFPPLGELARRHHRDLRRAYWDAGERHRLAWRGFRTRARDRSCVSGSFRRSAARRHPALDPADCLGCRTGARLAARIGCARRCPAFGLRE